MDDADRILDEFPLTSMQEGMLVQWIATPRSGVDIEQVVCTLPEPVNRGPLETAWGRVATRHAAFRTSFAFRHLDRPVQRVHAGAQIPIELHDWHELARPDRAERFASFLRADRLRGFDLEVAPAARLALFRFGPNDHRLVWSFHHILMDGRSFPLVLAEAFDPQALVHPIEDDRPSLGTHVRRLADRDTSGENRFWTRYLAGFGTATPLPVDGSLLARDGEADAAEGGRDHEPGVGPVFEVEKRLPEETTRLLRSHAEELGITLNTIVQSAWAILLARRSGLNDVVFGAVRACRGSGEAGAARLVGNLINTVPIRARILEDEPVALLMSRLRQQQLDLRPYEITPLAETRRASQIRPGSPLFESVLVYDHASLDQIMRGRGGSWVRRSVRQIESTGFPLTLYAYGESGLLLRLACAARRFSPAGGRRLLEQLANLLSDIADRPGVPTGELEILSPDVRARLLVDWNATADQVADPRCVHRAIEDRAADMPDVVAAVCGDREITYGELDRRAGALASELSSRGIGPDDRVAILVGRTIEMLLAVLAVLKAGGAYVPLDRAYPKERLSFMLRDSGARLLLVDGKDPETIDVHDTPLSTRSKGAPGDPAPVEVPDSGVMPEHLAYVIYTSGSTGRPKGVMVEHRNVANFFAAMDRRIAGPKPGTWLALTSLSFDISVLELLWTLARGFKTVVHAADEFASVGMLVARHGVTHLQCTPSLARMLLAEPSARAALRDLEAVLVGGERLDRELADELRSATAGRVLNMYGPTETTIWSSTHEIDGAPGPVPIGRPLLNTTFYVLDRRMRPVPIGASGELHIGGAGVARGYLGRADLTAERFVPDPFGGDRLYRTGDLTRLREDGLVEYVGRVDDQIKLRGHRIEPGEIEAVLCGHPAVAQAAVVCRGASDTERQLVAFCVPEPAGGLEPDALRAWTAERLPGVLVPSAFVPTDRLPLTPNGKIDRAALPEPARARESIDVTRPQTPVEARLAEIWGEVLDVTWVCRDDDFFELGGNSLATVQIAVRIREAFGVTLPLRTIFDAPSLADLARGVEKRLEAELRGRTGPALDAESPPDRVGLPAARKARDGSPVR